MQKVKINVSQLFEVLNEIKGAKFATIVTETEPKMKKTGNPFLNSNIIKKSEVNITLNFIYENSVNNQRKKEGNTEEFHAKPRQWGSRIPKTSFVIHKGSIYVEAKINAKPKEVRYFSNGKLMNEAQVELLKPFLPTSNSSSRQEVEKEVIVRDFKLENIVELKLNGNHYLIS